MSSTVYQAYSVCFEVFQEACTSAEGSAHHHELCDEFDKYNLWAGNVGAIHSGKKYTLSLDYRLRGEPFYRDQVHKLFLISHDHAISRVGNLLGPLSAIILCLIDTNRKILEEERRLD